MVKKWKSDKAVDICNYVILSIILVICVFPLLYVISVSLTPITEVHKNGGFLVIPRAITLDAYKTIIDQRMLPRAMGITAYITILGTVINIVARSEEHTSELQSP